MQLHSSQHLVLTVADACKWDGITANAMARPHPRQPATPRRPGHDAGDGRHGRPRQPAHPGHLQSPRNRAPPARSCSPLLTGVTGRYFDEDHQEAEIVSGGPGPDAGVADWAVDPSAADQRWGLVAEAVVSGKR